jgi:hypothetical protein
LAEWLLRSGRGPSLGEALAAGGLLALVAAACYGAFVAHGGFYSDDWSHVATYHFADPPRYWSSVSDFQEVLGGRPLFALLLPIPQALFDGEPGRHLALAAALGAVTSLCFYVLLRTLEMAPVHAAAIAILALLFPWSDSIRLWPTGSVIGVAVCLFLIGLIVALRGFNHHGRAAAAMHGAADALYLLSILTYEAAALAALLAGLLYRGRGSPSSVARRWLADVVVVLGGLAYSYSTTVSSRHVGSPVERLDDVGAFAKDSFLLLASSIMPFGSPGRAVQGVVLLLAAGAAAALLIRVRRSGDPEVRFWIRWMAIGVVGVAAAYFMFLGSHLYPRDPGIDNRINVFAGLAFVLLTYSLIAGVARLFIRSASVAAGLTLALALVIGVGYEVRLADDQSDWRAAADRQQVVLDRIEGGLSPIPPGSTLLSFGFPSQTAPEVPIFDRSWDLQGALQLREGQADLRAFPIFEGVMVTCEGTRAVVDGGPGYGTFEAPYGGLYFFEPGLGGTRIASRLDCARALRRYRPGPLEA